MKKVFLYKNELYFTLRFTICEVKLDLFNYATKSDLKKGTGVDTSQIAKKMI